MKGMRTILLLHSMHMQQDNFWFFSERPFNKRQNEKQTTYPLASTAFWAYSVWNTLPSGLNVLTERSYCTSPRQHHKRSHFQMTQLIKRYGSRRLSSIQTIHIFCILTPVPIPDIVYSRCMYPRLYRKYLLWRVQDVVRMGWSRCFWLSLLNAPLLYASEIFLYIDL